MYEPMVVFLELPLRGIVEVLELSPLYKCTSGENDLPISVAEFKLHYFKSGHVETILEAPVLLY